MIFFSISVIWLVIRVYAIFEVVYKFCFYSVQNSNSLGKNLIFVGILCISCPYIQLWFLFQETQPVNIASCGRCWLLAESVRLGFSKILKS